MSANTDFANAAARIYLQQGDIAARDIAARGQIWGQALTNIGQIAGQGIQQLGAIHQENQINDIFKKYGDNFEQALPEVMTINPELGMKIGDHVYKAKKWAFELQDEQWKADGRKLLKLNELLATVTDQAGYTGALYAGKQAGMDVSGFDPIYDAGKIAKVRQGLQEAYQAHQGSQPAKPEPFTLGPGQVRYGPAGNVIARGPTADETPPKPGTPEHETWLRMQQHRAANAQTPNLGNRIGISPNAMNYGGTPAETGEGMPATPAAPLSVAQVEGREPASTPATVTPPPSRSSGDTEAWLQAYAEQREAEAKKTAAEKHSPAYVEWQDYKASGGTLGFDAYMTRAANRKAVKVSVATDADRSRLVQAVANNPSLWDDLTNTEKGKIAPDLHDLGFTGFGKPLPQAAVANIAQTKSAIDNLKDLKVALKDNERFVGPIAGWQKYNPWSEAPQLQAKVDAVRQRVGKALEGGVLRKEDEEKYKLMLATLFDTPATAYSKIDTLTAMLENDVRNYTNEQRLAGRRVNTDVSTRPADAAPSVGSPPPTRKGYRRVKGPNGETGQMPIGAPFPKGWVEVK